MAELHFHIGSHKTGSTFLQKTLLLNVDRLREAGWSYPDFLSAPNHMRFVLPFSEKPVERLERQYGTTDRPRSIAELDRLLGEHVRDGQRWVASSEQASSMLGPAGLSQMLELLGRHFGRIRLVVYLRRQEFQLPSGYGQNIRMAARYDWDPGFVDLRTAWLDQLGNYRRWAGIVGDEHVVARPYLERYKRDPAALLADFLASIGAPGEGWKPAPRDQANESLSAEGVLLLRTLNEHLPSDPRDPGRRAVLRALPALTAGPGLRVSEEMALRVSERYGADNAELVRLLGATPEWVEWLEQPATPARAEELTISPQRMVQLAQALAVPRGPVDWSRSDLIPTSGPIRGAVSSLRRLVRPVVRRARASR